MERMLYFSGCGKRFHFRCSRITKKIGTLTRGLSGAETPLFQTRPISRNDSLFPERVLWLGTTIELCQLLRRNRKKSARSTSEYTSWPKYTQQTNNKLMTNFHKKGEINYHAPKPSISCSIVLWCIRIVLNCSSILLKKNTHTKYCYFERNLSFVTFFTEHLQWCYGRGTFDTF